MVWLSEYRARAFRIQDEVNLTDEESDEVDNDDTGAAEEEEDELRFNPTYLDYYYSHVNLNLRLSPPLLSREDSRPMQNLQVVPGHGVISDLRKLRSFILGNNRVIGCLG